MDAVTGRRLVLGNADVRISYVVAGETSPLYRNAVGDECVYVESGTATVETVFGALEVGAGRLRPAPARHDPPLGADRRRAAAALRHRGQLPHRPAQAVPVPLRPAARARPVLRARPARARRSRVIAEGTDVEVLVKHRGRRRRLTGTRYVYPTHPFDVVGWDGCLYPYTFNVADFEPITGRVHQPPPVHQVFEGHNFVICNFVPRKVDYHPLAVPVPYYHSNVDSDEVMFYCGGELRGPQGLRHRAGLHQPAPGRARARPAARRGRAVPRRRVLRRARRHGRHLPAARARRRRPRRRGPRRTPGPWSGRGPAS